MSGLRWHHLVLFAACGLGGCFTPTTEARFEMPDGGGRRRDGGGCQPSCGDRQCGPDGCGGACGTCVPGTFCDGEGRCGACPAGSQCGADCCGGAQACIDGACAACGCGERECGQDPCGYFCGVCLHPSVCDPTAGRCVNPDVCKDVYCVSGEVCDPADGACRCTATSCRVGTFCVGGKCRATCVPACSGETPDCDGATLTCRCVATSCAGGKQCVAGTCIAPDCSPTCWGTTPVCDPASKTCKCTSTSCGAGQQCVGGACVATTCSPACAGEVPYCDLATLTCRCTPASCGAVGKVCNASTGACALPDSCVPACAGTTPACDVATKTCRCTEISCGTGQRCVNGACQAATCSPPCAGAAPFCDPATLTCECTATSCPAGQWCDAKGTCRSGGTCDPTWQLGCAAGEGCYFDETSASYRCFRAGSVPAGNPCSVSNQCRAGTDCLERGGTRMCLEYCDPATAVGCTMSQACEAVDAWAGVCGDCPAERNCSGFCCPAGTACSSDGLCSAGTSCNPLVTGACPTGEGCYADALMSSWVCRPAGALAEGAACERSEECQPGLSCFSTGGPKQCRMLCSAPSSVGCGLGQACMSLIAGVEGICVACASPCGGQCCRPGQACSAGTCASYPICDPTSKVDCPAGQACYYDYGTSAYLCLDAGSRPLNSSCFFDWECQPGMGCLGPGFSVCLPYCLEAFSSCATGRDCVPMGDGYGWCG